MKREELEGIYRARGEWEMEMELRGRRGREEFWKRSRPSGEEVGSVGKEEVNEKEGKLGEGM